MKKIILKLVGIVLVCFCLSGCVKCINVEKITDQVEIIYADYRPQIMQMTYINKHAGVRIIPSKHEIMVEYNGSMFYLNDSDTYKRSYERYKYIVGQYVDATIEKRTFEDGRVTFSVLRLQ